VLTVTNIIPIRRLNSFSVFIACAFVDTKVERRRCCGGDPCCDRK
jgi:hypothetical protein